MTGDNLALRRPALQSSVSYWSVDPNPAVDAAVAVSGDLASPRIFHTDDEKFPWWQVDLGAERGIGRIEILNAAHQPERLTRFTLLGSLDGQTWLPLHRARVAAAERYAFDFAPPRLGRFLRVRVDGRGYLHFRQFQAFAGAGDDAADRAAYAATALKPEGRRGEMAAVDGFALFIDDAYDPVIQESLRRRTYENRERNLVCRFLEPDDRVLEAGTAIGLVAMSAAAIVGPEHVLTFDANPEMVADAEANFARNGLPIATRCGALVPRSRFVAGARLPFHVSPAFWASRLGGGEGALPAIEVPTFCLEDEMQRVGANVLICDIEGGEVDLLPEADLSALRLIILETHYWAAGVPRTDAMVRRLICAGFSIDVEASGASVLALRR